MTSDYSYLGNVMSLCSDIPTIIESYHRGAKIILLSENDVPIEVSQLGSSMVKLLPPYEVVSDYIDYASDEKFYQMYKEYLNREDLFITIHSLGVLLFMGDIMLYVNPTEWYGLPIVPTLMRILSEMLFMDVTNPYYKDVPFTIMTQRPITVYNSICALNNMKVLSIASLQKYLQNIYIPEEVINNTMDQMYHPSYKEMMTPDMIDKTGRVVLFNMMTGNNIKSAMVVS